MWCSERFATTASNGPGSARSSRVTRSNRSPSGARGSIASTSWPSRAIAKRERAMATADLEHAGGRGGEVRGGERLEVHPGGCTVSFSEHSRSHDRRDPWT